MLETGQAICAACAEVATLPGHLQPHEHMRIVQQKCCAPGEGGYDTTYHCLECDTCWVCHTDQWGFSCGFKLVPQSGAGECKIHSA